MLPQDLIGLRHESQGRLSEQRRDGVVHGDQPIERPQRYQQDINEAVVVEAHVFQSFQLHAINLQGESDGVTL